MSTLITESQSIPDATSISEHQHQEKLLSRGKLIGLSMASFSPAVGLGSVPTLMMGMAGYGSWLAALIAALATMAIGIAVLTFARRFVVTGSLYSYIGEVFGPWARYVMGATLLLGYVTQLATITVIVGMYAGSFLLSVGLPDGMSAGVQIALYIGSTAIVAAMAIRGLDVSVRVAITLAVVSVPLMLLIIAASVMHTGLELPRQLSFEGSTWVGVLSGLVGGTTFLFAFESSAALAAESKDPKRNVPLAVMSVPVILGLSYALGTLLQIPGLMAASSDIQAGVSGPATLALHSGLGSVVATAVDGVLAIAMFASLIGFTNYGSRFVVTLAQDGLLPSSLGKTSGKWVTPKAAILMLIVVSLVLNVSLVALNPSAIMTVYFALGTLIMFFWILPYLLICVGAVTFMYRQTQKLSPGLLCASICGCGTMIWVFISSLIWPPAPPIDLMTWVFIAASLVVTAAFAVAGRRHSHRAD